MNRYLILTLVLLTSSVVMQSTAGPTKQSPVPLPHAHAHNDYYHKRPLLDALDQGFCSVEADVFLVNGRLLVGHSRIELNIARSLRSLYLEPLKQRVAANQGRVFRQGPAFTMLIDIKSDADATYSALRKLLTEYDDILSTTRTGKHQKKAVTVVISGNRAQDAIARTTDRHAGIDGRLADINSKVPSHLMPLISDNWQRHFHWRGQGEMSEKERQKLREIVKKIHQSGRRVRFWATPEDPKVWSELLDAGVDLIGSDDLASLSQYLKTRNNRDSIHFQGLIEFPLPPHAPHVSTAFNPTYSPLPPHSGHTLESASTNTSRLSDERSWSAVRRLTSKPGTVAASRWIASAGHSPPNAVSGLSAKYADQ